MDGSRDGGTRVSRTRACHPHTLKPINEVGITVRLGLAFVAGIDIIRLPTGRIFDESSDFSEVKARAQLYTSSH